MLNIFGTGYKKDKQGVPTWSPTQVLRDLGIGKNGSVISIGSDLQVHRHKNNKSATRFSKRNRE